MLISATTGETTERAQAWVDDLDEVNALVVTRSSISADLLVRLINSHGH